MKRIVLPVLFTFLVALTFGQDLKKATNYVNDKNYEKAKTEIDGILAKDPTNSQALYLKSKVYRFNGRQLSLQKFIHRRSL